MRIVSAIKADIKFQIKQGFYTVYIVLTLIYMLIVHQIPEKMSRFVVPIVVYFDPTIVGFFFIGGIVMLEKSQGILNYLVVTPLRSREYLMAKAISLTLLAMSASGLIVWMTYEGKVYWLLLMISIGISSFLFTLYGFLVATKCKSINEYFVRMLPYMLAMVLPCFLLLVKTPYDWIFNIFPSVAGLKLIYGAFLGISWWETGINLLYLGILSKYCLNYVNNKIFGGEFSE